VNDPAFVATEYADPARLAARRRVWHGFLEGPNSDDEAFSAVAERQPATVLEVGAGWGGLAERMAAELPAKVTALDVSPVMAGLARDRGVRAAVADAQALPMRDGSVDVVLANAMLYHLPDLGRGLREIARVLRDGGALVATTFAADHLSEVWELLDGPGVDLSFNGENGEAILREHFGAVQFRPGGGTVRFPDAAELRDYVAATITRAYLASRVPDFEGPFVAHSSYAVFVATEPLG
jgi:SAM-dependent methyltransferase